MNDNTPLTKADFDAGIKQLKEYIDERTHDAETRLLRAFSDYNDSASIRFRKLEADTSNIDASTTQRLGVVEKQLADFQMRLIALEGPGGRK
jgi:hypothetical protein